MAVKGIGIGCIYCSDYNEALLFYRDIIGLENFSSMNNHSCYFSLNDTQGIYLIGGCKPLERESNHIGCTIAFDVDSVFEIFEKLKENSTPLLHNEPMQMNENMYWFQAKDPSGNIIEFLGGK